MNYKKINIIFSLFLIFSILFISGCNLNNSDKKEINKYNLSERIINKSSIKNNTFLRIKNQSKMIIKKKLTKINISKKIENKKNESWFKPKIGISWQWQLNGNLNLNYKVNLYDIDLFDTPKKSIDYLHKKGIKVICYFSAGSFENWRKDAKEFPKEILGNKLDDWDEKWLNIKEINQLSPIMKKRLDLAVEKNCDGIEPDNIDGYINNNGFNLTFKDQLKYNIWLANEAHKRNLSIGLKNDLDQINDLVNYFDFAINEQCFQYNECNLLKPFIKNNKPVLGVEYELKKNEFCNKANNLNFSWLKMNYELEGERGSCN